MGLSRQEYWSGLLHDLSVLSLWSCVILGNLPDISVSPHLSCVILWQFPTSVLPHVSCVILGNLTMPRQGVGQDEM